jgi:hypothetical protein
MDKKQLRHESYLRNKEKILNSHKIYVIEHKDKIALYQKEYRKNNRVKLLVQHENARKLRLKNNINTRITYNLRARLHKALHRNQKINTTIKLLGCDVNFLKIYLKNLFSDGMTWENYGKWEIDHIVPCSSFDLSKPEEQRRCFHYTNLQPLWENENIKKGKNV